MEDLLIGDLGPEPVPHQHLLALMQLLPDLDNFEIMRDAWR